MSDGDVTIGQANAKRATLETRICGLLQEFERETGASVIDVGMRHQHVIGDDGRERGGVVSVKIDVVL